MLSVLDRVRRGEVIRADAFNDLVEAFNRSERPRAGGPDAHRSSLIDSAYPEDAPAFALVRMLYDAVPADQAEAGQGDPGADFNAAVQVWDEEAGGPADLEDGNVAVEAPYGLPLLAGDVLLVWFDPSSGRWLPAAQKETEMVRVLGGPPTPEGYLDGLIQYYDVLLGSWQDGAPCWVLDANAGAGDGVSLRREVPAGAVNGSNRTFTLAVAPVPSSLEVFENGLLLTPGTDYGLAGATLTFVTAPPGGAVLAAYYQSAG